MFFTLSLAGVDELSGHEMQNSYSAELSKFKYLNV